MSLTLHDLYLNFEHYNKVFLTEEEIRAKFKSMYKEYYDFNKTANMEDIITLMSPHLFIQDDTSL